LPSSTSSPTRAAVAAKPTNHRGVTYVGHPSTVRIAAAAVLLAAVGSAFVVQKGNRPPP